MNDDIRALIFDLDGVLCATDGYHYLAWKDLADRLRLPFDRQLNDRLRGISRMDSLNVILNAAGKKLPEEEKLRLAEEKNEIYRRYLQRMTPASVPPEVRPVLEALRERGYLLAVGSSSKNAGTILERTGLSECFDAVADGTDISRSKPDPEVFLKAAEKLRTPPACCAVIEDAKTGIEAAKAAGMTAIAFFGDAAGCGPEDFSLSAFSDLLRLFPGRTPS